MTREEILKQLTLIFHAVFDDDTIVLSAHTTAKDIPAWDSLNHVHIIVATELHFGIKFKTAEVESLSTIGDAVTLIQQKLDARQAR